MADNRGLILWTLCGAGVFLLYAAYKNQSPQTLLLNHLNGTNTQAPISGGSTVPTITDAQGNTWNTAPGGSGGSISTDPPTPGNPAGSGSQYMLGSTHSLQNGDGTYTILDSKGKFVGVVDAGYQNSPYSFKGITSGV